MSRDVVVRDEQWALVRNATGHPEFLIVAGWAPDTWIQEANGRPGFASFDVYEINGNDIQRGVNGPDGEHVGWEFLAHFGFTKAGTRGEHTHDLDEAVRIAYGSVKWDGCCDYMVSEQEDLGFSCFLHACDVEDLRLLSEAIQVAYRLCATIVEVEKEETIVGSPGEQLEQTDARPVEDWVTHVYSPAIGAFTTYFAEAGVPHEIADHNARALLARLAHLEPPLTIERLG